MDNFELFNKDGEIRLVKWKDLEELFVELIRAYIPFCVVYDGAYIIVRSIDYCIDSGEK